MAKGLNVTNEFKALMRMVGAAAQGKAISDLPDDLERIYAMRKLKTATLYGMPYKDQRKGIMPKKWQNVMAQKYIYSRQWRKMDWRNGVNLTNSAYRRR